MNIMIMGKTGRMNTIILQLALERSWSVEFFNKNEQPKNKIDALIDFSSANAWADLDIFFEKNAVPLISGTTGIGGQHQQLLQKWATRQPVYHSPNFSKGVAALRSFLKQQDWSAWEVSLSESHHKNKKDAPSGTALLLAQDLAFPRDKISVIREDDNFGEHTVVFKSDGEELVIQHRAFNRHIFASAALDLVSFIKEQAPGDYSPH